VSSRSRLRRWSVPKVRIIGAALGSIMPSIITHHMANTNGAANGRVMSGISPMAMSMP